MARTILQFNQMLYCMHTFGNVNIEMLQTGKGLRGLFHGRMRQLWRLLASGFVECQDHQTKYKLRMTNDQFRHRGRMKGLQRWKQGKRINAGTLRHLQARMCEYQQHDNWHSKELKSIQMAGCLVHSRPPSTPSGAKHRKAARKLCGGTILLATVYSKCSHACRCVPFKTCTGNTAPCISGLRKDI